MLQSVFVNVLGFDYYWYTQNNKMLQVFHVTGDKKNVMDDSDFNEISVK